MGDLLNQALAANEQAETATSKQGSSSSLPSGIRDNRERGAAGDFLREHLRRGTDLSIVSAYFTINAYHALREQLRGVSSLRFLFGDPRFVGDLGHAPGKSKAFRLTEDALALDEQLQQSSLARDCHEWIDQAKIQIRSTAQSSLLHGKMYHLQNGEDARALLGSSNFTKAGLGIPDGAGNVELNLVVDSARDRGDLRRWFDEWWQNEERTTDVKGEVLRELQRIYAEQPPQFIYYLTLFNLFRHLVDSREDESTELKDIKLPDTKIWQMLFQFQKDGATAVLNRLKALNGCILADSVGLGKTFTALAVIKYFELRNERVLVLCPKKLRKNWTLYRSGNPHNILAEDRLHYSVASHTDLSRDGGEIDGQPIEQFNWGAYSLVVIDESHNFRNNNYAAEEGKRTRYERLLMDVIRSGVQTKVLLLSATPVNNTLSDLRNQISLIAGGDVAKNEEANRAFEQHFGISSVAETTKQAQARFTQWTKKPAAERKNVDLLHELGGDLFKLLDNLTIARSRRQLQRGYGKEVSKLGDFPRRAKPESIHSIIDSGNASFSFESIDDEISRLSLALYNPSAFLREDLDEKTKALYRDEMHQGFTQDGRERILVGMMKIGFLKRLESSVDSFRLTLQRTVEKIDHLNEKLDAFEETQAANPELDYSHVTPDEMDAEDEEMMVGGKRKFHLGHIDIGGWRHAVNRDRQRLQTLHNEAAAVDAARDAKLAELRQRIAEKLAKPTIDKDGRANPKVLIFAAYADTAEYLYKRLSGHILQHGVHAAMVRGSGDNHCTISGVRDYNDILTRFSPRAREGKDLPQDQTIDVLIATDCISEGQNLQDCDLLINYDIHWNPVRIIQRFGRIDRIGSRNKSVHLVNFWPTRDLDRYLKLKHRVEARMALVDISATMADNPLEDEQLEDLVTDELQFRNKQLLRLQKEVLDLEDVDEGLSLSDFSLEEFRRELMQFLESRREELESAPLGIYSVVPAPADDPIARPGAIFCLRQPGQDEKALKARPDQAAVGINPLHPHYLVYVRDDGTVRLNFTQPKQALTLFRELAAGRENALPDLCRLFDQQTDNGADMAHYHGLVKKALSAIRQAFNKRGLRTLTGGRDSLLPPSTQTPSGDDSRFELVTWLAILASPTRGDPS